MSFEPKDKEEVIEVIKKSFFIVVPPFLKAIVLAIPSIYALMYLDNPILNIVSFVWLVIVISYFFYHWINWAFDHYIITNQRILEIKNKGVFTRYTTEMPLERIDNSKCSVTGFFHTVLGFGSVKVYSISKASILIENVSEPKRIQNLISEVKEKVLEGKKSL